MSVSAAFPSYMYVEKAAETDICTKNSYIECWWNWHQEGRGDRDSVNKLHTGWEFVKHSDNFFSFFYNNFLFGAVNRPDILLIWKIINVTSRGKMGLNNFVFHYHKLWNFLHNEAWLFAGIPIVVPIEGSRRHSVHVHMYWTPWAIAVNEVLNWKRIK